MQKKPDFIYVRVEFLVLEKHQLMSSMLESIASLEPMSVPINFFHPNEALPLVNNPLSKDEAFKLVEIGQEAIYQIKC